MAYRNVTRTGLAQTSGGQTQWGIPGTLFSSTGTSALNVNEVRYAPFSAGWAVTLTALLLEVTTAPASNANVAVGVYAADGNMQPTGAPVYDSGSIAVASGFTGTKTLTSLSIHLVQGAYLIALNADVAMTVRTVNAPTPIVANGLGATPFVQRMTATQTYGAYPNPPTAWTATNLSGGGVQHSVVWQWTDSTSV